MISLEGDKKCTEFLKVCPVMPCFALFCESIETKTPQAQLVLRLSDTHNTLRVFPALTP